MKKIPEGNFKMIATTFKGLEKVLVKEVLELGGQKPRTLIRAVEFYGDLGFLYKANLKLRTALRVLRPIAHLRNIKSVASLYNKMYEIPWEKYFDARQSVAFHVSGMLDSIPHTKFVSQKTKDALVDRFRDQSGKRPDVKKDALIHINLHLFHDQISVSLDSSGAPLFKRGYREETGMAPINEVLAAGIIRLAGWNGDTHFIDPMTGSGTFPIEAALMASNIPPGIFKEDFSFMHWKDFDEQLYQLIRESVLKKVKEPFELIKIIGYDKDPAMIEIARQNATRASVDELITFETKDFFKTSKIPGPVTLVFNPPYDKRLSLQQKEKFYKRLAQHLEENYRWTDVWIISPEKIQKFFRRKPIAQYALYNGKIPVWLTGLRIE